MLDEPFSGLMMRPPTVRCIGVEMRPLSLGHVFALSFLRSPFVCGTLPTYEDLVLASYVCSNSWEENKKIVSGLRLTDRVKLWIWGKLAGKFDILDATAVLSEHVRYGCEIPRSKKPQNGRHLYSDWNTRLYSHLRFLGMSHIEAMDTPLLLANRLLVAHLEETGAAEFYTQQDEERERALSRALDEDTTPDIEEMAAQA